MATQDLTLDQYAPLTHKLPLRPRDSSLAPTWVPPAQRRRLDAYKVLAAYRANVSRHLLPDQTDATERREYGDAELLVARATAGVLGDTVQIVVDGADDDLPDTPELPPEPGPLPETADPIARRIHTARTARWADQAARTVDEWEQAWNTQPSLQVRQEWLRAWAETEFLTGKIVEAENDIAGLGDGVYVLDWSDSDRRPTVDVYDPGFYFPVLDDTERGYPTKVHLAWEFDTTSASGVVERFVRRVTYQLGSIPFAVDDTGDTVFVEGPDGAVSGGLQTGDRYDPELGVVRPYPWAPDQPSTVTCLFTDATWPLTGLTTAAGLDNLNPDHAVYARMTDGRVARHLDMHIDFVPVVHIPNTPATREHFGRSILDVVAQILDDLQASDTDVQAASALAAGPVIALSGGNAPARQEVTPGVVWGLGENGRMDVLDLSAGLEQLGHVNLALQDRLSVNSRIPAEVLGRVKVSEAPSGIAIALTFGPFRQLVELLRLTRDPKYRLLLKMVQRFGQAGGVLDPGPNPTARVVFGSYLPSDLSEATKMAVALLQAHGVSRRTALRLLVDAGVDIGDLVDELARIDTEDTSSALQVAEATGSEQLAATRLGLDLPDATVTPVVPPTLNLPPPPAP